MGRMEKFLNEYKIKQLHVSSCLHNDYRLFQNINISKYENNNENTLFFGVYSKDDYDIITNHKGKKVIFWAGNDADILNKNRLKLMKTIKNVEHFAINKDIYNNLIKVYDKSNVSNIY